MNRDVCEHFNPIDLPCDRCGKRTRDGDVHTCTPKALLLADWCDTFNTVQHDRAAAELRRLHAMTERRLTDEVIADLWARNGTFHHHFARAIERWLKGQE
jgi:hypothetical protein